MIRFRDAARKIGSCEQAMDGAKQLKARVFIRTKVPLASLVEPLRMPLNQPERGVPTAPFGTKQAIRVLLACPDAFEKRLPTRPVGDPEAS